MVERITAYLRNNVLGLIALFIALGGVAYAAGLPKNSVTSKQIKAGAVKTGELANNAVTSPKVANGSLQSDDFAAGQIPHGPPGAPGTPGAPGQDATNLFAYVRDPGSGVGQDAVIQYGKGATSVVEPQPASNDGFYHVTFNRSLENCVAQAQTGVGDPVGGTYLPGGDSIAWVGLALDPGNNPNTLRVITSYPGFGAGDASFQITVFC
jgi:hypothetical protein